MPPWTRPKKPTCGLCLCNFWTRRWYVVIPHDAFLATLFTYLLMTYDRIWPYIERQVHVLRIQPNLISFNTVLARSWGPAIFAWRSWRLTAFAWVLCHNPSIHVTYKHLSSGDFFGSEPEKPHSFPYMSKYYTEYIYIYLFIYHFNNCNRKVKNHPSQTSKSLRMRPSISTSCPGCMCSTRSLELGQPNPSVDEGLQLWSRQARVTWLKGSKVLSSFI